MTLERVEQKSPLLVAVLRRECEVAKRTLSREAEATVRIPAHDGSLPPDCKAVVLTRGEFEEWTDIILSRTDSPIRRCLGDAKLRREQIDEVLLVGGATRMPAVRKRVAERFGREPRCTLNPDEVVALGAAVQAGLIAQDKSLGDIVVTDVSPFTLGIEICQEIGGEDRDGYFMPIINRNTPIPTSRSKTVGTLRANQTEIQVSVYQGDARRVEGNLLLGEFSVKGVPRGPAGQLVEVRFSYDLNGVLEVEATVVATKAKTSIVITKHAQGMSPEQIQAAVATLQSLKAHPREEDVNKRLYWQAERLFKELPLHLRQELDDLLRGFDEVMELRDVAAIDRFRQELDRFLRRHDNSLDFEQPFE